MACVQNPVPHHLGACVVFAVPPVFVLPEGTVGARLVVVEGVEGGRLFGKTHGVGVAGGDGESAVVSFVGCGVDRPGKYVFGCEYATRQFGAQPVVRTAEVLVARTFYPSAFPSKALVALSAAILHVTASSKLLLPTYVSNISSALKSIKLTPVLPLPPTVLAIHVDKISVHVLSKVTSTAVVEALSDSRRKELIEDFKSRAKTENGREAAKVTSLRVSKSEFDAEAQILNQKIPPEAQGEFEKTPLCDVSISKSSVAASGIFVDLTKGGGSVVNTQEPGGSVVISGYIVKLPSRIVSTGGKIVIKAHLLLLPSGGCDITVSGEHGNATPFTSPALPGHNGEHGPHGTDAGSVLIYAHSIQTTDGLKTGLVINATGGDGGDGQHGGSGAPGANGDTPGSHGSPGGRGGSGGNAGHPGKPGLISVQTTCGIPSHIQLVLSANPGATGRPGQGGAGGPGGQPGPPDITPNYISSGWWWSREYSITTNETEESKCKREGPQGPEGPAGEPYGEPNIPLPPLVAQVPLPYVWGHILPKYIPGRLLQAAEILYQQESKVTGFALTTSMNAAGLMWKAGRGTSGIHRRASLLHLQFSKGYCYWGYRPNFYPLVPYGRLRVDVDELLVKYGACYDEWQKGNLKGGREKVLRWKLSEARNAAVGTRQGVTTRIKELKRVENDLLASVDKLNLNLAVIKKSLSQTAQRFTQAVADEATLQAIKNFKLTDNAEFFSKAMTLASAALSIYPALPPSPSVIDAIIAQGRDEEEAVAMYYKMAQESLLSIGAHVVSTAREFWRDEKAIKQKTEEALSQVILESQQDKGNMPLQEVDRWVAGVGLTGERVKVRDTYLAEVRRYQRCVAETEEESKRLEVVREKVAELQGDEERAGREVHVLGETQGRVEAVDVVGSTPEFDEVWTAAKRLAWGIRLLALSASRVTGAEPKVAYIPGGEPPTVGYFNSVIIGIHGGVFQAGITKQLSLRTTRTAAIQYTAPKLTENLIEHGSCVFGIGPTDSPSLSLLRPDPVLTSMTVMIHPPPNPACQISLSLLGTPSIGYLPPGGPTQTYAHPQLTFAIPGNGKIDISQTELPPLSPFTLYRLSVTDPRSDEDSVKTPLAVDTFEIEMEVSCRC